MANDGRCWSCHPRLVEGRETYAFIIIRTVNLMSILTPSLFTRKEAQGGISYLGMQDEGGWLSRDIIFKVFVNCYCQNMWCGSLSENIAHCSTPGREVGSIKPGSPMIPPTKFALGSSFFPRLLGIPNSSLSWKNSEMGMIQPRKQRWISYNAER